MAKFGVIALSVGGLGNKIHYSNEIVDGSAFEDGHVEQLVKDGFLKPLDSEQEEKPIDPGPDPDNTGGQEESPASAPPAGGDVKTEIQVPPADLGKELADKARGAKTPAKK